jgi:hypothetical protein
MKWTEGLTCKSFGNPSVFFLRCNDGAAPLELGLTEAGIINLSIGHDWIGASTPFQLLTKIEPVAGKLCSFRNTRLRTKTKKTSDNKWDILCHLELGNCAETAWEAINVKTAAINTDVCSQLNNSYVFRKGLLSLLLFPHKENTAFYSVFRKTH